MAHRITIIGSTGNYNFQNLAEKVRIPQLPQDTEKQGNFFTLARGPCQRTLPHTFLPLSSPPPIPLPQTQYKVSIRLTQQHFIVHQLDQQRRYQGLDEEVRKTPDTPPLTLPPPPSI